MRKTLIAIIAVVVMLSMAACVSAEKTTLDPNASGQVKPQEEKPDTRLEQKVTYQAARKSVRVILAELSEQTGVPLKAGINDRDWQVRDRKMNVFAKDVPLKDLMDSIGRVMKFVWATGGKGDQSSYRLFMDRKSELDAEGKRLREEEKQERELAEKREKTLERFSRADELSEADLEKLKKDSPYEYLAVSSGIAGGLGTFFNEAPAAMEALASGSQFSLNAGNLSSTAQNGLVRALEGIVGLTTSLGIRGVAMPEGIAGNMSNVTVHLNQNNEMIRSSPMAGMMLGEIRLKYGEATIDLPMLDPDSKLANMFAKAMTKSQDEGRPFEEVMRGMQAEMMGAFLTEMKRDDTGEAPVEHPDDPALDKKIKLEPKGQRLDQVQQALQEASEYAVVSDSFGSMMGVTNLDIKGEMTIKDALKGFEGGCRYNWFKRGQILEFRDRDWYKKRASQIPDAWIEGWNKTLKQTGTLDLIPLAEIAALTGEELNQNVATDEDLSRSGIHWTVMQYRDLLRFYGSLSKPQQAAIAGKGGLDLRTLSAEQWTLGEKLIMQRAAAFLKNRAARLTLSTTKAEKNGAYEYIFVLATSEDLSPVEYRLTTPKYVEPKKEAEKKPEETPAEATPAK